MRSSRSLSLLTTIVTATCCATSTTSNQVAKTLSAASPRCTIERDSKLVLGKTSLKFLRVLGGIAGDDLDDNAREILDAVDRVGVTTYRVDSACGYLERDSRLVGRLASQGWRVAVSSIGDDGELSWVLTREAASGEVAGMLVIALDHDELEIVRLDGDIERILVAAVADDPSTVHSLGADDS